MSDVCGGDREDLVRWAGFGSSAFPPGSHGRALENRFGFVATPAACIGGQLEIRLVALSMFGSAGRRFCGELRCQVKIVVRLSEVSKHWHSQPDAGINKVVWMTGFRLGWESNTECDAKFPTLCLSW